jgi:hypothetical protein
MMKMWMTFTVSAFVVNSLQPIIVPAYIGWPALHNASTVDYLEVVKILVELQMQKANYHLAVRT